MMSRELIITCDRCGKRIADSVKVHNVQIISPGRKTTDHRELCEACVFKLLHFLKGPEQDEQV